MAQVVLKVVVFPPAPLAFAVTAVFIKQLDQLAVRVPTYSLFYVPIHVEVNLGLVNIAWVHESKFLSVITIVINVDCVSMTLDLHGDEVFTHLSPRLHHSVSSAEQLVRSSDEVMGVPDII